eukprot:38134-Pelagomonas_calceolata.AAC.9
MSRGSSGILGSSLIGLYAFLISSRQVCVMQAGMNWLGACNFASTGILSFGQRSQKLFAGSSLV